MGRRVNSNRKGKEGERELANKIKEYGYEGERGQQHKGGRDSADVVGLPGIHIECKRYKKSLSIYAAIEQAVKDSGIEVNPFENDRSTNLPVVMHRKDHCEWLVAMRKSEWVNMYTALSNKPPIRTEYSFDSKITVYDLLANGRQSAEWDEFLFGEDYLPAAVHGKGSKPTLITMRLHDWMKLYREYEAGGEIERQE